MNSEQQTQSKKTYTRIETINNKDYYIYELPNGQIYKRLKPNKPITSERAEKSKFAKQWIKDHEQDNKTMRALYDDYLNDDITKPKISIYTFKRWVYMKEY